MRPIVRNLDRIRDVLANAEHLTVRASCRACAHVADVDWLALAVGQGQDTTLEKLARRMRCQRCNARACGWHVTPQTSEYGGSN